MRHTATLIGQVKRLDRMSNSRNGNPRWVIRMLDNNGDIPAVQTPADTMVCYAIDHSMVGQIVVADVFWTEKNTRLKLADIRRARTA